MPASIHCGWVRVSVGGESFRSFPTHCCCNLQQIVWVWILCRLLSKLALGARLMKCCICLRTRVTPRRQLPQEPCASDTNPAVQITLPPENEEAQGGKVELLMQIKGMQEKKNGRVEQLEGHKALVEKAVIEPESR